MKKGKAKKAKQAVKRTSSGFGIAVNDFNYQVAYDNFNDKVVYCYVETPLGVFSAKAKCDKEDVFNEVEGKRKSLERAIEKYRIAIERDRKNVNALLDNLVIDIEKLPHRLEKNEKRREHRKAKAIACGKPKIKTIV